MCDIRTFYIYLEHMGLYEYLIELFKKYNIGCVNSIYKCVAICTFTEDVGDYYEGDVLLKFETYLYEDRCSSYNIGETIFQFPELAEYVVNKYFKDEYSKILAKYSAAHKLYAKEVYKKYKLFEKLPFSYDEYYLINDITYVNSKNLEREIEAEGFDYKDVIKEEEISLIPTKPENKYMDKVNTLYALLENEIEEKTKTTKGETYVIIDLDSIKNEIEDIFKDTEIEASILKEGLYIGERYFILYYDETNEEGNKIYLYDDSEATKIEIARKIRRKDLDCLY